MEYGVGSERKIEEKRREDGGLLDRFLRLEIWVMVVEVKGLMRVIEREREGGKEGRREGFEDWGEVNLEGY